MIDDGHRQFLLEQARAGHVRHSGRTLYTHLCGTHALLEAWGNPEHVCNAGLFHSIYGTRRFRHRSWPLELRGTIVHLIGRDAEFLAYLFGTTERKKAFFFLPKDPVEREMMMPIQRHLREIEAANLIEQGTPHSTTLLRLRDSDISEGAMRAIEQHLKEAA